MPRQTICASIIWAALIGASPAALASPDLTAAIKADYDTSLSALWDHSHRNPELSYREHKTAARMAQELPAVPGVVVPFRQTNMGAEDFAYFVAPELKVPGYYFAVSGTKPEWIAAAKNGGPAVSGHHSPLFKIDPEPAIRTGAEAMTLATLELLKR